jgi:triosephosphate isomerase
MSVQRKKIVAGNWKMNGTVSSLEQIRQLRDLIKNDTCEVIVCPPTTLISQAIDIVKNSAISIGSQNCHEKNSGAYTGEVSPEMLVDLGVQVVILGHSERRENNFETSKLVQNKAKVSHKLQLTTIICIGETEAQKNNGNTINVIKEQLDHSLPKTTNDKNTIIAYEPIWAIGSGKTPSADDIKQVHKTLRTHLERITTSEIATKVRILYGGSVNSDNCYEILNIEDVDGALVGGASLSAIGFSSIINSTGEG